MAIYFWLIVTIAVLAWYSTITIYVAIRGTMDVKQMLKRLEEKESGRVVKLEQRAARREKGDILLFWKSRMSPFSSEQMLKRLEEKEN